MVFTRLAAVKKKKYILPTNKNNNNNDNSNNDASINVVSTEKPTINNTIVPETQTQIVDATQGAMASTWLVASQDEVSSISDKGDMATEPKKTPVEETKTEEKSSDEASAIATPPSTPKRTDNTCSELVLPSINILQYGYKTPEKKPFELPEELDVSPTCLAPTPDFDPWFSRDEDQIHCCSLIQNLHHFPLETSEQWLKENYCQFQKFVNDNNLVRVKVLTNMWLQDGKQHAFPAKTPEDNITPSAKARLEKDLEYEKLNKKYEEEEKKDIFSSLNCDITKILSSPEKKSIVRSLKRVSSSLMTCQKLYAEHFKQYEEQETEMFTEIMHLNLVEQETCERNRSLEQGNARLEANVEKLRFQLRQKNIHESNLRKTFLAQKKELKALDENKILKLENELLKVKSSKTSSKETTKLDNEKLKETIKSIKVLHKDQIRMKDVRISELNATIKSMKTKLKDQEKSLEKVNSKFVAFQRQSATSMAKLEHKKELMEIKDHKKQESIEKKKKEKNREKEIQKRKLQDAINLHHDFVGVGTNQKKKVQERIINNFRSYVPPPFASAMPPSRADHTSAYLNPQVAHHPFYTTQGVNYNINHETIDLTQNPSTKVEMIPNFISLLNSLDDGNEAERERKKSKLMKVCVNHTRSALKKKLYQCQTY